jgi:hypothetical protein
MYILISLLVVIPGLLYWLYWRWANKRMLDLASTIPGPPAYPMIGNTLIFLTDTTGNAT